MLLLLRTPQMHLASPGADGDVLLLLCECVGPELSHNLHRPGGTLPCKLEGCGDINDDLLLSGLGLTAGTGSNRHTGQLGRQKHLLQLYQVAGGSKWCTCTAYVLLRG